jgi:hypothetical protein
VHLSFTAPALPRAGEYGENTALARRALARHMQTFPIDSARREFLRTIERLAPKVLITLALMPIDEWVRRWNLDAPWVRTAAENTLTLWQHWPVKRGRCFDMNLTNTGIAVPSSGRLQRRPPEILVPGHHFEWLVLHRVLGVPCSEITSPPNTSGKAARNLARRLGL